MFFLAPLRIALKLPILIIVAAAVYVVVSGVQVVKAANVPSGVDAVAPARAAVVLGEPLRHGALGADFVARLQQAVLLYDAHRVPEIFVSGPTTALSGANPASVARAWLVRQGVPVHAIVALPEGNAAAALQSTAELLGSGARVVLVTDAIDALWARALASSAGLRAAVSPAIGSKKPVFEEVVPLLRQASAIAAGRVIGYGRATWAAN